MEGKENRKDRENEIGMREGMRSCVGEGARMGEREEMRMGGK
jgi:hypothetical protein